MSWTDRKALETIWQIQYEFDINTFFETGTFKGVNAEVHSEHFDKVITCEKNRQFYKDAQKRLKDRTNVRVVNRSSEKVIKDFREHYKKRGRDDNIFFYLDAHFYDPTLPKERKWAVLNELKALKGFKNSAIMIHDFAVNGLGHCCYNGECLDWKLIGDDLMRVNPDFKLYVNDRGLCDILEVDDLKGVNLRRDTETLDNLEYANSSERLKYRGIIYALPRKMDINLNEFNPDK